MPNAIIEAMATGLIVISTFHAGIPELIENGVNGYLVHERDVASYVETMAAALSADDTIGRNAHEAVKARFNLEVQNRRLVEIYGSMLG